MKLLGAPAKLRFAVGLLQARVRSAPPWPSLPKPGGSAFGPLRIPGTLYEDFPKRLVLKCLNFHLLKRSFADILNT